MPTNPPQPTTPEYPLSALKPDFIRDFVNQAGYAKVTGKQPPTYNPDLPTKTWDDTRAFTKLTNAVDYNSAVLDVSLQKPIEQPFTISAATAKSVNIPPDSGPIPPSTAGSYPVPIRKLLTNERLLAHEGGVIDVINTDLFDPEPLVTIAALVKKIAAKVGV